MRKGRRRLAVISGSDERAKRRQLAFQAAASALGLDEVQVVVVPAPTTLRSGRAALVELMQAGAGPDAVFCSSDLLALGVMTQAQASGIAVPEATRRRRLRRPRVRGRPASGVDDRPNRRRRDRPAGVAIHRRPRRGPRTSSSAWSTSASRSSSAKRPDREDPTCRRGLAAAAKVALPSLALRHDAARRPPDPSIALAHIGPSSSLWRHRHEEALDDPRSWRSPPPRAPRRRPGRPSR